MYNIIQLNEKDLSELQEIAKELGLKKTSALKKEELVYRILDEQAIKSALKKSNPDKNESQTKKRARISVKKEGDKVYTANKDKATKLEANTPVLKKRNIKENKESVITEETPAEVVEKPVETTATEESKPKAKRGRKPGSKNKATNDKEQNQTDKAVKTAEEKTVEERPVPVFIDDDMELPPLDLSRSDDFIPIEDLPSEKFEIPSELIGKFEATKVEPPVVMQNDSKFQQKQKKANNKKQQNKKTTEQQAAEQAAKQ